MEKYIAASKSIYSKYLNLQCLYTLDLSISTHFALTKFYYWFCWKYIQEPSTWFWLYLHAFFNIRTTSTLLVITVSDIFVDYRWIDRYSYIPLNTARFYLNYFLNIIVWTTKICVNYDFHWSSALQSRLSAFFLL